MAYAIRSYLHFRSFALLSIGSRAFSLEYLSNFSIASCCVSSFNFVSSCETRMVKLKLWINKTNMKKRNTKFEVEYVPTIFDNTKKPCGKILARSNKPAMQNQKMESSSRTFAFLTLLVTNTNVKHDTSSRAMRSSSVNSFHHQYAFGKTE